MKKYIRVIIGLIAVVVVGYLVYSHYFWGRVISIRDVTKEERITLFTRQSMVNAVRLHITGTLDGEAVLFWDCSSSSLNEACSYQERLLPGKIDIELGSDWYEPSNILKYQPSNTVKSGNLKIRYSL